MKPTGEIRVRIGAFKKLVLQIEVTGVVFEHCGGQIDSRHVTYFRDAQVEDLAMLPIKGSRK